MKNTKEVLRVLWEIIKENPLYIVCVSSLNLIDAVLSILNVYFVKKIIEAISFNNYKILLFALAEMITYTLVTDIVKVRCLNIYLPKLKEKVIYNLNCKIYKKSLEYTLKDFDNKDFLNKYFFVLKNSDTYILSLIDLIINVVGTFVSLIGIVTILCSYDKYIVFIILLGTVLSTLNSLKMKKVKKDAVVEKMIQDRKVGYIKRIFYLRQYAEEIRLFNLYYFLVEMYSKINIKKISIIEKYGRRGNKLGIKTALIDITYQYGILVYLCINTIKGKLNVGGFMVTYSAVKEIESKILSVFDFFTSFYDYCLYINMYIEYMNKNIPDLYCFKKIKKIRKIKFENVSFRYENQWIIRNLSFEVKENSIVAIRGKNGSGKTTLLKLICGFYKVSGGKIKFNEQNIDKISVNEITNHISSVFQDFQIYATSIIENICLKENITDEEVDKVKNILEELELWEKINNLPNGVYTEIGKEFLEQGEVFSKGEMQKIAIARAIFKNAEIILLDEPFSSLDENTNRKMIMFMKKLAREKIVIYVTHEMQSLNIADKIIELENGSREEQHEIKQIYGNNSSCK